MSHSEPEGRFERLTKLSARAHFTQSASTPRGQSTIFRFTGPEDRLDGLVADLKAENFNVRTPKPAESELPQPLFLNIVKP